MQTGNVHLFRVPVKGVHQITQCETDSMWLKCLLNVSRVLIICPDKMP